MRKLLFTIIILPVAALSAEMYKWTDENGVVHYSDRPHPGAERIEMRRAQSYSTPPLERSSPLNSRSEQSTPTEPSAAGGYESLSITSPTSDEVLWNIAGTLNVNLSTNPRLRTGHSVEVFFDGQLVSPPRARRMQFEVNDVVRGEHSLRAQIIDRNGNAVAQSDTIRFYVQQTAIQRGPANLPSRGG